MVQMWPLICHLDPSAPLEPNIRVAPDSQVFIRRRTPDHNLAIGFSFWLESAVRVIERLVDFFSGVSRSHLRDCQHMGGLRFNFQPPLSLRTNLLLLLRLYRALVLDLKFAGLLVIPSLPPLFLHRSLLNTA
jgi:hypothetical protein